MEELLRDIIMRIRSKVFRDYYLEHLPEWNLWQITDVILSQVNSRYAASSFFKRLVEYLPNTDEKAVSRMLSEDLRRYDDIRPSTESFVKNTFPGLKWHRYFSRSYLGQPKLFSEFEVVKYWIPWKYGNGYQIGFLASLGYEWDTESETLYEIYNLRRMDLPSEDITWVYKADLVKPFFVDKYNIRCLDSKCARNLRIIRERIAEAGKWPIY